MKRLCSLIIVLTIVCVFDVRGQQGVRDKSFRPTFVYKGYIQSGDKRIEINLSFLILLDSSIVGSYYYNQRDGDLKLAGHLFGNNEFTLSERNEAGELTGIFTGVLSKNKKNAEGKWKPPDERVAHSFHLIEAKNQSYWYYIKKNRALYEYKDFNAAIREKHTVVSIDVADMELVSIPNELAKLDKIVSINLLGNNLTAFPKVLSRLITLDEISLSSNKLVEVGPEIGNLKNLRILIMNFNKLKELPEEIGQLTNLLYLELGRNQLTSLPSQIKYLTQLQELHLEGNPINEKEKHNIKKALPNCLIHF
jgi:Leucine-rich repeat (LRR) protein